MAGWLTKATKSLSRKAPEVVHQPFAVLCGCRNEVSGIRESRHQIVRCAKCGSSLFVLPRNPYPQPAPPSPPTTKTKPSAPKSAGQPKAMRVSRDAESAPVERELRVRERRSFSEHADVARTRAKGIVASAVRRQREIFTPFRLVVIAMAAVAAVTGYWAWHSNAVENAGVDFKKYADSGEQEFSELNFAGAAGELTKAVNALELLKRDDPRAESVRQMLREATAASKLLNTSLLDVIDDAQEAKERSDSGFDKRFATLYGQNWMVICSRVEPIVDGEGVNQLVFDYPLPVDGKRVVISARVDQAEQVGAIDQPRQVIVAAKLKSCATGGTGNESWIIRLDPASVFYWTSFEPLVALGVADKNAPANDPIRTVIDQQRLELGVER